MLTTNRFLTFILGSILMCSAQMNFTDTRQTTAMTSAYQSILIDSFDLPWTNLPGASCDRVSPAASALVFALSRSQALEASNFGFQVPTGANISCIEVVWTVQVSAVPLNGFHEIAVALFKARLSTEPRFSTPAIVYTGNDGWQTSSITITYPLVGDNPLWSEMWTAEEINSPEFGVSLRVESGNTDTTGFVHCINVTLQYESFLPPTTGVSMTSVTSSSESLPSDSEGGGSSSITIAVSAGAGILYIIGMCAAIIIFRRKRRYNSAIMPNDHERSADLFPHYNFSPSSYRKLPTENDSNIPSDDLEMDTLNDLNLRDITINKEKMLGQGKFGEVYEGMWCKVTKVACKRLKKELEHQSAGKQFIREVEILKHLKHTHVVQFFGIFIGENDEKFMVMEFMERGSLLDFLQKHKDSALTRDRNGLFMFLQMCMDIAAGMDFVVRQEYVHRDLAARNLLVNQAFRVKIADFGTSRKVVSRDNQYQDKPEKLFPVRWSAPEVLKNRKFTLKSDVWSYGVVVWEIFTEGDTPYFGMNNEVLQRSILGGRTLADEFPKNVPEEVILAVKPCWIMDPIHRPSFRTLYDAMEKTMGVYFPSEQCLDSSNIIGTPKPSRNSHQSVNDNSQSLNPIYNNSSSDEEDSDLLPESLDDSTSFYVYQDPKEKNA